MASQTPSSTSASASFITRTISLFELYADEEPRNKMAFPLLYAKLNASTVTFGLLS